LLTLWFYRILRVVTCRRTSMIVISKSKGHQIQVTSYYEPETVQKLKALSEVTRIPQAAFLREALDDLLKKYAGTLRKAAAS
jgi:hypothetical protein